MISEVSRLPSPPIIVRLFSHVAAWTAVLVPVIRMMNDGWRALGDYAAIAARAHQTISLHPPSIGMYTTAAADFGRQLFDPGPLLFWLLAVPVRIDPSQGLLLGAGLLACAAFSLAIEAVWTTKLWVGCAVLAFAAVDLMWLTPTLFESIAWNAYFPIPVLFAAIAVAWCVSLGHVGWWPALVFVASVMAQCHLVFVLPAVLLAIVAPILSWLVNGAPQRFRWVAAGLAVGFACWIAPLTQNFGMNGNLSALARGETNTPVTGLAFGLRTLARAGSPVPIWMTHEPLSILGRIAFVDRRSVAWGALALVVITTIAVAAWWKRNCPLATLSTLCLVNALSLVVNFALLPKASVLATVYYLIIWIWVTGILLWTVVIWGLVEASAAVWDRRPTGQASVQAKSRSPIFNHGWVAAGCALAGVTAIGIVGLVDLHRFSSTEKTAQWDSADVHEVAAIASRIERSASRGHVTFRIESSPGISSYSYTVLAEGIAWQLDSDGWSPGLYGYAGSYTGLEIPAGDSWERVTLEVHGGSVESVRTQHCSAEGRCLPVRFS